MVTTPPAMDSTFRPKQIYEQVSGRIRADIRSGQFAPESRLPSERELAARFGVGRPAVREAIGALQNEGLVITRRNSGTYVCADALQRLSAARGAINSLMAELMEDHILNHMPRNSKSSAEAAEDVIQIVKTYLR